MHTNDCERPVNCGHHDQLHVTCRFAIVHFLACCFAMRPPILRLSMNEWVQLNCNVHACARESQHHIVFELVLEFIHVHMNTDANVRAFIDLCRCEVIAVCAPFTRVSLASPFAVHSLCAAPACRHFGMT